MRHGFSHGVHNVIRVADGADQRLQILDADPLQVHSDAHGLLAAFVSQNGVDPGILDVGVAEDGADRVPEAMEHGFLADPDGFFQLSEPAAELCPVFQIRPARTEFGKQPLCALSAAAPARPRTPISMRTGWIGTTRSPASDFGLHGSGSGWS
jgi:hypothetical protein